MALPVYCVEVTVGYRNPARHGIRGETRYAVMADVGTRPSRPALKAEAVLAVRFRSRTPPAREQESRGQGCATRNAGRCRRRYSNDPIELEIIS